MQAKMIFMTGQIPMTGEAAEFSYREEPNSLIPPQRRALLWVLFFLICMGLGYPPLNRYDPGKLEGTSDVAEYRAIVAGRESPGAAGAMGVFDRLALSENYYRILVPYAARPFYWLVRGHVGSWDPALFSLLIANSIFTATTACLLVVIGLRLTLDTSTALLATTLFLLNFCIANLSLVGLVDSAEECFLMVIVWSLLSGRWFLLPLWGIFGALAKETFVPLSALFVFGWWISGVRRHRLQLPRLVWLAAMGVVSITTVTIAMSVIVGGLVWPWQLAAYMRSSVGFFAGLRRCLVDHSLWFVFMWLLPLGLVRLRRLPRPWVLATAVAFCGALALGAYHNSLGNVARALFSVSGPILSLSAAIFLAGPRRLSATAPDDELITD
jgi:hypothetical protein